MVVERNRAVFTEAPTAVPDGNVDVSGGGPDDGKSGRMPGRMIDSPIFGNGDLLAAVAGKGRYPQFLVLRPMTSGRWKVRRTGSSFMITRFCQM